ncbi:MAG TPA: glucose-1-phosphatase, partial [Rikenellaceae bacterium]|nr:glucose-1-phosphatase [Rikenellaceae bacterium]
NIRSPLVSKSSVLTRLTNPEFQWFQWEGQPSTLTAKGERLEAKMGAFFHEWAGKKGFLSQYSGDSYAFRFYANAKQRCQLTARSFADALLPGQHPRVEMNVQFDTMDPVFTPQITKISDSFVTRAQQEIAEQFGDLNARMAGAYALLEDIIDIEHSPAYPDTTSFSQFPSAVSFKLNAEPSMSGGLKMACTISDALSLQYYEEPDDKKAGFGKDLTFEDWVTVSSVKEWYGDVLFTAPSVSVNVAHPLLQLILGEMQNESRIFSFLCGHDSNVGSVLAALEAEIPDLPGSVEKKTPIGCKLIFETFTGADKVQYADILLIYATAAQLRAETALSFDNPPAGVRIRLKGLKENADGLYILSDVQQRFTQALTAYDKL